MNKYRNRLDVIADMLSVVNDNDEAKKTKIMYRANMSWNLLNRYLNDLLETGLVNSKNSNSYVLTGKGKLFLQKYREYHKRHKKVEEQAKVIESEKMILENMAFNSGARVREDDKK